jgi:hypothetical protein
MDYIYPGISWILLIVVFVAMLMVEDCQVFVLSCIVQLMV